MAGLFKNKIIKAELERFEIPDLESRILVIKNWVDFYDKGELQKKTETQCEQAFNQDIFINILGYKPLPADVYNIIPKDTVDAKGGQKPDATLGYFDGSNKRVVAVVEIKDANTPLDKSQRRDGNLTPIQQAFKYKPQYQECGFVVVTNFVEIRLFRDNQLDYEIFTLKGLLDPKDNYFNFRKFYYLLSAENFVTKTGQTQTEKLLANIRIEQEKITHKFYTAYKSLRSDLIRDILTNNPDTRKKENFLTAVEKAQKVVDRIVFICFLEDSGLLPDSKLLEVISYADKAGISSWAVMKDFFNAVDRGSEKLEIPDGYNGELFKQDILLDSFNISDDVCKKFAEFSKFDFSEDLSVNILGHIFEQSISDLEEIKSLSEDQLLGKSTKESKRKKEGVYYTPEYIVDYIVRNSLGRYLEEKEEEILSSYNLGDKRLNDKGYDKKIVEAYGKYVSWLKTLKILDPACGSGAFLVKVYDYLLGEHKRVGKIIAEATGEVGSTLINYEEEYIKPILEQNIYGVDLNPESVEITKLSLWLKSAKKGKKLITLKGNVKCGNSLVSDPAVAGERAFDWQTEFSDIITNGGFDVIIGNPPYIKEYTNKQAFDGLHTNPYYEGKMDLWQLFACLGIDLLKKGGYLSYIAPSSWLTNSGAKKTRNKILQESKIEEFIDFGDYNVFEQAGIQTMIFVLKKTKSDNGKIDYLKLSKKDDIANFLNRKNQISFKQAEYLDKTITFIEDKKDGGLLDKILSKKNFELTDKEVANGIHPHYDFINKSISLKHNGKFEIGEGIFGLTEKQKNELALSDKEKELVKNYYNDNENLGRYFINPNNKIWLIYTDSKFKDKKQIEPYHNIKQHLDRFVDVITSSNKPYGLHRARDERFFIGEKIVALRKCPLRPQFSYIDFTSYFSATFYIIKSDRINLKYLTGILNSSLIKFWLKNKGKMQGDNFQLDKEPLLDIPICLADEKTQKEIIERVENIISKNSELREKTERILEMLRHELGLEKVIKKLEAFYTLSFDEFIALSKKDFSIDKKQELISYFNKSKDEILNLKNEIGRIDNEIDNLVYKIYGLTDEEIKIIAE